MHCPFLTWIPHSGCAITLQLFIYAMTSPYFQESLFLQFILSAQQQSLPNQCWWELLYFSLLMMMVTSIHSRWPMWIICPSLLSIYFQWEFSENSLQIIMVLIGRVWESHQLLMIKHSFGIMVNSERLSGLTLLGFQNICLALVILNYNLLQHFWCHTMMTRFTGLMHPFLKTNN